MKVLLTQDVYNLGQAGEVKTVADGYGRNFLLPRGMAILATPGAIKRIERIKQAGTEKRAREKADVNALAQVIGGATVTFNVRAGEKGKLYGSITSSHIADQISKQLGNEFDKRKVALREPIREIGTYTVPVRLSADVAPNVTVVVQQEGTLAAEQPTPAAAEASSESAGSAAEDRSQAQAEAAETTG